MRRLATSLNHSVHPGAHARLRTRGGGEHLKQEILWHSLAEKKQKLLRLRLFNPRLTLSGAGEQGLNAKY